MTGRPGNRYRELFKNTGLLAIGNFSSKILVFLLVPLYTNILSTAEYGLYDIFVTTVQLLIPVLSLNVADGVLRFVLENENTVNQVFRVALKYSLISIILVGFVLIFNQTANISIRLRTYGIFVFGYYISYMFNQLFIQFAKGLDKVSKMMISGVIGTVVTITSCMIGFFILKLGLIGFFCANILGQLIPAVYLFFALKLWRYIKKPPQDMLDRTLSKRLLKYSIPLIMTTIGWWLNNTSDKYVITAMRGVEVNGLLSIAYKIPSILTILYGIFIQAWQISAMKEYGKEDSGNFYNKIFVMLNIFVYAAASVLIIGSRLLARIAFAKEFYNAWIFVPYLLISAVFTASAGYIAPILTSGYKTWAVAKSTIIGGMINVFLNIVLVYRMGSIGVAVSTLISSFIILYMRYRSAKEVITRDSFRKGCFLWVLLCVQATLEMFQLELLQIPFIILALTFHYREIRDLFNSMFNSIRRKK